MGFDVDRVSKVVTVDHNHNSFATTSVAGNPKTKKYNNLTVIGIIKRNKGANKVLKREHPKTKIEGDNSPMLYALKNMDGLSTTSKDARSLFRNARKILHNELPVHGIAFDYILTVPSSHKLASIVAQLITLVCRKLGHPAIPVHAVLHKASGNDVKEQVSALEIKRSDRQKVLVAVKRFIRDSGGDSDFQIKCVRMDLRKHVNLFVLGYEVSRNADPLNISLVDDMVTSGSSLISARNLVQQVYPNATIYACVLFSAS